VTVESVALLPDKDRSELFSATAAKRGVVDALIEKDFWVCLVLKEIFETPQLHDCLLFKGGTCLSKVFGLISRFSEDIDLVLDWRRLGITDEQAWDPERSATQQDKFNEHIDELGRKYIADEIVPVLSERMARLTRGRVMLTIDSNDGHVVAVRYPRAFSTPYLLEYVKLEIGPRASRIPHTTASIRPYAAQEYPHLFTKPSCEVKAIVSERSFWEKATILHQIAFMPERKKLGPRYSRHYYDLYRMRGTNTERLALADVTLLEDVAAFKARFYRSPAARYDLARPGTLKLVPARQRCDELALDYAQMREMIFADPPAFRAIVDGLQELEVRINTGGAQP